MKKLLILIIFMFSGGCYRPQPQKKSYPDDAYGDQYEQHDESTAVDKGNNLDDKFDDYGDDNYGSYDKTTESTTTKVYTSLGPNKNTSSTKSNSSYPVLKSNYASNPAYPTKKTSPKTYPTHKKSYPVSKTSVKYPQNKKNSYWRRRQAARRRRLIIARRRAARRARRRKFVASSSLIKSLKTVYSSSLNSWRFYFNKGRADLKTTYSSSYDNWKLYLPGEGTKYIKTVYNKSWNRWKMGNIRISTVYSSSMNRWKVTDSRTRVKLYVNRVYSSSWNYCKVKGPKGYMSIKTTYSSSWNEWTIKDTMKGVDIKLKAAAVFACVIPTVLKLKKKIK